MSRGRPALSAQAVDERRASILQAALLQISERGVAGVRMKDVARTAEVSVGAIQHYFDSREDLVFEAFQRHTSRMVDRLTASATRQRPPWESLNLALHDFLHVDGFTERTRLWTEFVAASARDDQLRVLLAEVFTTWKLLIRDLVRAGVADGSFHPAVDEDVIVDCLLAQMDGFEIAHASRATGTDTDRIGFVLQQTAAQLLGVSTDIPIAALSLKGTS